MQVFRAEAKAAQSTLSQLTFDGFDNFVSRLGLNNDNTLSAGTYTFDLVTRNRIKLEAAYRGSWAAGKIVDIVAEDMTSAGITVTTNEDDSDLKDLYSAMSRLKIWQSNCANISWGRLYGGSLGILQIKGQKLDTPLDLDTITKDQFEGIAVYDRWQLNPDVTRTIDSGPDIGLPKYYNIVSTSITGEPIAPTMTGQVTVHHSRVIRMIGIELPFYQAITELMWGESVLERLWDRLISFDNATMSSASLIDRANLRTVQVDGLREVIAAGGEAYQALLGQFEMMRQMQVNEGLTVLDKNDAFASTAYTFSGLSDMMLQFAQQLAGAADIPLVRFFCQSPAGLNATGDADLKMYAAGINSRQEKSLRGPIDLVLKVMWRSIFGKLAPKDLQFTFNPLWQPSPLDMATTAKTNAETVLGAYEAGVTSRETTLNELRVFSGKTGLFSNITDEDVKEAEDDPPPGEVQPGMDPKAEPAKEPVKALDRKASWLGRFLNGK